MIPIVSEQPGSPNQEPKIGRVLGKGLAPRLTYFLDVGGRFRDRDFSKPQRKRNHRDHKENSKRYEASQGARPLLFCNTLDIKKSAFNSAKLDICSFLKNRRILTC